MRPVKLANLRRLRERQALSQKGLAERAGISHVTVVQAEAGGDVRPTTARKLAEALGVEPAELMAG